MIPIRLRERLSKLYISQRPCLALHRNISRCFPTNYPSQTEGDVLADENVSATSVSSTARKSKRVERKKYSDLPVTYLPSAVAPAAPLPEWLGGSEGHVPTLSLPQIIVLETDMPKTKRRKGPKVESSQTKCLQTSQIDHLEVQDSHGMRIEVVKSKRRKRAEITKAQVQDQRLKEFDPTATIQAGTDKPKRRKLGKTLKTEARENLPKRTLPEIDEDNEFLGYQPTDPLPATKITRSGSFLAQEIQANLKRYPHCLLLTRVGQFYESYFDQAVEISRLLNIKLTSRKLDGERIAMCGFPLLHLDRHLKALVQHEKRFVAMCEEFPRHTTTGSKEFDRRVTRIVTPGTLIDESFLNPLDNNYLLAISSSMQDDNSGTEQVGLAWIDVSTGEIFSKQCISGGLQDELARLAPREVVLDSVMKTCPNHPVFTALAEDSCFISYNSSAFISTAKDTTTQIKTPDTGSDLDHAALETSAISLLSVYLQENMLEHMPLLLSPAREGVQERMQIDSHTIKGLEIRERIYEGGSQGSLLSMMKRTVTSGGTRLLARWLCSPSTSIQEINARQSLVAFFHRRTHFRADISKILKEIDDVGRLCQKFLLGRADFNDLVAIHTTVEIWSNIQKRFQQEKVSETVERPTGLVKDEWHHLDTLLSQMCHLDALTDNISKAILVNFNHANPANLVDGAAQNLEEGLETQLPFPDHTDIRKWTINPSFSKDLSRLHMLLRKLLQQKKELEGKLQLEYDVPSLTLRSSPGLGFYLHLARAKRDRKAMDLDPVFHGISETATTKTYFYKDWSELGNKLTETFVALTLAEKKAFEILRQEVIQHSSQLRQNAQIIDELDVALSFALLAVEMNFIKPVLVDEALYNVVNGRHPSVEMGLLSSGRQYTPNSVEMTPSSNLHIITGPNMAGKSTFLRQTALIAILAQVGSFVPAESACIGVVDKLFSRIGAKDDLFRDRSTFMVEMLETADILRRATAKSLVIMDEVGRGTTVKDGLAISYATLHHLARINQSRCLFATHFHELADMVGKMDNNHGAEAFHNVRFYCSDVEDTQDGHFTYSYRLRPGVNRDSHGLKVALLAGMPPVAMKVAANTLAWLKNEQPSNWNTDI
ncbi:muts domain V-domain-containing protein [Crassisporium funariophilum]|nr:muts domain V-domain-containing protein [Crassisporium funariophilum]